MGEHTGGTEETGGPDGLDRPGGTAGIGLRAAGRVIDVVLVMAVAWLLLAPLVLSVVGTTRATTIFTAALAWAVVIGYETWFTTTSGQTIGKRALGLRVVSTTTGEPPRPRESFLRAALPPFLGTLTAGIGWVVPYLWAVWDRDRRGLHDRLAGTRVVPVAI